MYLITRVDQCGAVSGILIEDEEAAVKEFIRCHRNSFIYSEVSIRKTNQTVVTIATDRLTYATIFKVKGSDERILSFSCQSGEGEEEYIKGLKIPPGYEGKYYSSVKSINFMTGEIDFELYQ